MRRLLTHSLPSPTLSFAKQVHRVQKLLVTCPATPTGLNSLVPRLFTSPTDVLSRSLETTIVAQWRPVFVTERKRLVFDAEYVGVKFGLLHPNEVDLGKISHAAFIEVLHKTEKPELLWRSAEKRLNTMKRGECVHLLRYFPKSPVKERVLKLSEGLKNSEEFCSLCASHNETIQPLIVPLYQRLLKERPRVDSNFLARALPHLSSYSHTDIQDNLHLRVLMTAAELCPQALRLLADATERPDNAAKAVLAQALENSNLDWFTPDDLFALVERFEQLGVTISRECEGRLVGQLLRLLSSPLSSYSSRASALLHSLQKDALKEELTFLPNPPKENSSPLVQTLQNVSVKELSTLVASAPILVLVEMMQLVQYRMVEREGLLDSIQSRLHSLISPQMSPTEALHCCEVLGRLSTLNRVPQATVEKLAGVVQANPEWVTASTVVGLAHQFSYATFNHAINKTICQLIKENQRPEAITVTAPSKGYYYKQANLYHVPSNLVLNNLYPHQVAVLLISLQKGRMLDPMAQEIVHQYIKCLLPSFASLSVKHRSNLVLCASYRENFSVSLWNELVRAVRTQEHCKFDTPATLRSLAVYHSAATNVRNLLRNIPLVCEQPLELIVNGEQLQDYSAATNPRRVRFS